MIRNILSLRCWLVLWVTAGTLYGAAGLPPGALGETITIDADQQFQFAENYFSQDAYFNAISEYERFVYFFPEDERVPAALYKIGQSYFKGNRLDDAIRAFQVVIAKYDGSGLATQAYFDISACYSRQQAYALALKTLDALLQRHPDLKTKDEVHYRKGWIFLEMGDWNKARESFEGIRAKKRDAYGLQGLLEDLDKGKPPGKNPRTAGFLALLPGAGHLYCERYQDALISFVLNGAMIIAAWEAFDNDNEALGSLLTLFELGFYSGNIYSAVNSAHKYNRKQKEDFLRYLRRHTTVETSALLLDEKPAFALTCTVRF